MGTLYSASSMEDFNLFLQEYQSSEWTKEENKMFESALAMFDEKRPDRWLRVAEMIPGKTVIDVIKQYQYLEEDVCEIESGRFEIPAHLASAFRLELVADDRNFDANRKKSSSARGSDQERKKGIPWTEDEHRRFLMGLLKYGKGDWRNISRNYVMSKTPTQVASHAQKYFMRQHSGGKDKRRPSIHDITTNSLTSTTTPSENNRSSSDQSLRQQKFVESPKALLDWNVADDGGGMVFGSTRGNLFEPSPYDVAADGILQKLYSKAHYAAHVKPQSPMYLMQA